MSNVNRFDDKTEIIKQIGKGSFSNVYLCRQDLPFLFETADIDEYFIVKEININHLVKKYVGSSKKYERVIDKQQNSQMELNITPYIKNDRVFITRTTEQDYYYKRLQELIESEIDVLYNLQHENIIKFYECKKMAGIYHLHMEYCEFGDVYDYLKNVDDNQRNMWNGVSYNFIKNFILQVGDGLQYIHSKNYIHRDIKLNNILIKKGENAGDIFRFKLSDFGFACYDITKVTEEESDDILLKKYYKLCGTPYYMAPEIILNANKLENFTTIKNENQESIIPIKDKINTFYDNTIDLWGLGICIYELIFNKLPFPKIRDLHELELFYKSEYVQNYINEKISKHKIPLMFENSMGLLLKINYKLRNNLNEVIMLINTQELTKNNLYIEDDDYEIELDKNMLSNITQNEDLTKHISNLNESDEYDENYNGNSSLIKVSVEHGFLNWLFKK